MEQPKQVRLETSQRAAHVLETVSRSLPYVLVVAVTGFVGVVQLTLVRGDLFNSYPILFSDSFDWIMQGAYLRALFGGESLPPLQILRDPGFLVLSVLDQVAGGKGLVILPALTAANALGAAFVVRSLALLTPDWRLQTLGVGIYLLHPALASLRFYVLADQLAVALMAGSFFFMMRWLQQSRERDYLQSALLAAAAFLTQKYGVLPFLIGLGLSGLDWPSGPRDRRHFTVLAVGVAVALGPELLFIFVLRHWIPHEAQPTQLGLLEFSLANLDFYGRTWFYMFACLVPLLIVSLTGLRAWMREKPVVFAFLVAISFNLLAFFARAQDARYASYSYVAVIVALVASFARAWHGEPDKRSALGTAALAAVLFLGAYQLRGMPVAVLAPTPSDFTHPRRGPWPKVLLEQRPMDRFDLQRHCGGDGHFCNAVPFVTRASPYQTYTGRYYNCLKTRRLDRCGP